MKAKHYTKLKLKLAGHTLAVTLGVWILVVLFEELVLGRLFHHVLRTAFVHMATNWGGIGVSRANALYAQYFSANKPVVMVALLAVILLVACYRSYSRVEVYLNQITDEMQKLVEQSDEAPQLPEELSPVQESVERVQHTLQAQQELYDLNEKRRKDLVAYLAHDLKTPLTSILGYLELLKNNPDLDVEQRSKYTSIALEKAYRLEKLLGEFFDISRMELANKAKEQVDIRLDLLLEQLVEEFYPLFGEKELTCDLKMPGQLLVRGNPDQLARTFDNVLRNAVNYSDVGSTVTMRAVRRGDWAEVAVSNQGLEIPEAQLSSIFQKFYRLDEARQTRTGGAGLGLAIAKEIVELHGGTIQASSTGQTTTFTIRLPACDIQGAF